MKLVTLRLFCTTEQVFDKYVFNGIRIFKPPIFLFLIVLNLMVISIKHFTLALVMGAL